MSCPVCKRVSCDHSLYDRGQSFEQMMADTVREEQRLLIQCKENLTLKEAEELGEGERVHLTGIGVLEILDPKFPVIRKGGRVIQRSLLVKDSDGKQKLLIIAEDKTPSLVTV